VQYESRQESGMHFFSSFREIFVYLFIHFVIPHYITSHRSGIFFPSKIFLIYLVFFMIITTYLMIVV